MHRPAIDADDEAGDADQADKLEQGSLVGEIDAIFRSVDLAVRFSNDNDTRRRENLAKFLDDGIGKRFVPATGEGMEKNERRIFVEARESVAGGKRTAQRIADLCPGAFGQLEVTLDGVFAAIHLGPAMIKKARTFATVAHAVNLFGATEFSDERTAKKTLKIERQIGRQFLRLFQPRPKTCRRAQAGEIAARENVDMIDIGISAQERGPFRIDHPGNLRARVGVFDQRDRGQGVNDVTERARLDDQY